MTEANSISTDTTPIQDSGVASSQLHAIEAEKLNNRIVELLAQVEALRAASKDQGALEHRFLQLRQANQNLVLATFGAQDGKRAQKRPIAVRKNF